VRLCLKKKKKDCLSQWDQRIAGIRIQMEGSYQSEMHEFMGLEEFAVIGNDHPVLY
jgi:hypothetical protein